MSGCCFFFCHRVVVVFFFCHRVVVVCCGRTNVYVVQSIIIRVLFFCCAVNVRHSMSVSFLIISSDLTSKKT